MIADAVRYMSVHSWKQPDSHGHSGTSQPKKQQPARRGIPSSRAVSAGSGRCWVRTSVGLADGFTDRFPCPSEWPLTCTHSQMGHVNNVPCPLYVRGGSDAKRLTPRTGTESVRTSHLTCSFTPMAPSAHGARRALPGHEARDIGLSRPLSGGNAPTGDRLCDHVRRGTASARP
jgi:hypothetical protein